MREGTSHTVRFEHPIDYTSVPDRLLDAAFGATCSYKAFDFKRESIVTLTAAISQNDIEISNIDQYQIGQNIEVKFDDGALFETSVTAVDTSTKTITVADVITKPILAGAVVKVKILGPINMPEYGTPGFKNTDWGFAAGIDTDDLLLNIGDTVQIVINFIGAVVGGLDSQQVICELIEGGCDE